LGGSCQQRDSGDCGLDKLAALHNLLYADWFGVKEKTRLPKGNRAEGKTKRF
jgi:hypothetical protein